MDASKIARARFALAAVGAAMIIALVPATSHAADDAIKQDQMPSYPALMKMKPTEVMKMMDTDKGGYVTREEFLKFYGELFERLDRDKSQQITPAEFTDAG